MRAKILKLADAGAALERRQSSPYFMAELPDGALLAEDVELYLGKRKTRKSTRAKARAGRALKAGQSVVALDYHDEWSQLGNDTDEVVLGPLKHKVEIWELLADPELLLGPSRLSLAVVPSTRDPRTVAAQFAQVMTLVCERGDTVLAADEVATWGPFCAEKLDEVACNSRHDRVPLILVGQRANKISLTTRSQATHINSGLQTDPTDLDALAEVAGQDFADAVRQLERGEYCHWRDVSTGDTRPTKPRKKP
jgi:hypothetical protein